MTIYRYLKGASKLLSTGIYQVDLVYYAGNAAQYARWCATEPQRQQQLAARRMILDSSIWYVTPPYPIHDNEASEP